MFIRSILVWWCRKVSQPKTFSSAILLVCVCFFSFFRGRKEKLSNNDDGNDGGDNNADDGVVQVTLSKHTTKLTYSSRFGWDVRNVCRGRQKETVRNCVCAGSVLRMNGIARRLLLTLPVAFASLDCNEEIQIIKHTHSQPSQPVKRKESSEKQNKYKKLTKTKL